MMTHSETILPEYDDELVKTRELLSRLKEEHFDFTPHPKSWPLGKMATHVATLVQWTSGTLDADEFDLGKEGANYKEPKVQNNADLLALFDAANSQARLKIAAATDEQWAKQWSLLNDGAVLFTMPKAAVFRSMIMNHLIHHRAQLTIYMRLVGIPVPGLYGPSADES